MAEMALSCFLDRIVVDFNDLVQVTSHNLRNLMQTSEIVLASRRVDKGRQSDRCQIADGNLVRSSILDDLSAQIRASDRAQVLLVALPVAGILVQHVRSA